MNRVLFSNRMGGKNLLYIGSGFAIAGIFIAIQDRGADLAQLIAIIGGLFTFCIAVLWLIMTFAMRSQIAELVRHDDMLEAEMIHIIGRGRKLRIPVRSTDNWRWTSHSTGRRGGRSATIRFDADDRSYSMPLHGASQVDLEGLHALAPAAIGELLADRSLARR